MWEETHLNGDVAEGNSKEDEHGEDGMNVIDKADAVFFQVREYDGLVVVVPLEVDDKEALEGGDAVVDLAISAYQAL